MVFTMPFNVLVTAYSYVFTAVNHLSGSLEVLLNRDKRSRSSSCATIVISDH